MSREQQKVVIPPVHQTEVYIEDETGELVILQEDPQGEAPDQVRVPWGYAKTLASAILDTAGEP